MARKPMVTRTIVTTKVNVLCMELENAEPFNQVLTLPRTYANDKKLFKAVEEIVNNDQVKAVHVVDKEEVETLYGMDEHKFIENASILDKATRKPIDVELPDDIQEETTEE